VGATVAIGAFAQRGIDLDPAMRVDQAVAGPTRLPDWQDARFLERFWFDADAQRAPIGLLSGGERRRLQLVLTLRARPNVVLLDEPTNDLDLDTLRALEDFLESWSGIVVAVSHDRAFLDRVTDELLALDGHGGVRWVRGGVGAWLAEHDAPATPPPRPAVARSKPGPSGRSPSTIRRQLGQAERDVAVATAERDRLGDELTSTTDHEQLATLSADLAAAQVELDAAEEQWLALAAEAEELGLDL